MTGRVLHFTILHLHCYILHYIVITLLHLHLHFTFIHCYISPLLHFPLGSTTIRCFGAVVKPLHKVGHSNTNNPQRAISLRSTFTFPFAMTTAQTLQLYCFVPHLTALRGIHPPRTTKAIFAVEYNIFFLRNRKKKQKQKSFAFRIPHSTFDILVQFLRDTPLLHSYIAALLHCYIATFEHCC
jgi:hypothetical protein